MYICLCVCFLILMSSIYVQSISIISSVHIREIDPATVNQSASDSREREVDEERESITYLTQPHAAHSEETHTSLSPNKDARTNNHKNSSSSRKKAAGWPSQRYNAVGEPLADAHLLNQFIVAPSTWIKPKQQSPMSFYVAAAGSVSALPSDDKDTSLYPKKKPIDRSEVSGGEVTFTSKTKRGQPDLTGQHAQRSIDVVLGAAHNVFNSIDPADHSTAGEYVGDSFFTGNSAIPMTLSPSMVHAKAQADAVAAKNIQKGLHSPNKEHQEPPHFAASTSVHAMRMRELLSILNPDIQMPALKQEGEPAYLRDDSKDENTTNNNHKAAKPYVSQKDRKVSNSALHASLLYLFIYLFMRHYYIYYYYYVCMLY